MTRFAQIILALYALLSGLGLFILGTLLSTTGLIGFFGVEVREWAYWHYWLGIVLVMLGALIVYGINQAMAEEDEA